MRRHFPLAAALMLGAAPATAGETISYSYDARGRLVQVARSGTVNDGVVTSYAFDKADNRTSKIVSPGLASPSFEEPEVGTGFAYGPAISGVTFVDGAGIAGNGSSWGFAAAPDGDQVAFLQSAPGGTGSISQSVTGLTAGSSYKLSFFLAQRPGYGSNPVTVKVAGSSLGTFTPPSTSFTLFTTSAFRAGATTATVEFTGSPSSVDAASAFDMVSVALATPP